MNQTASKASLMYSFPELIRKEWYWDYNNVLSIDPKKIKVTYGKPVFWKCPECGSIYLMTPKQRLACIDRSKTSCFTCRGRVQIHSFTV